LVFQKMIKWGGKERLDNREKQGVGKKERACREHTCRAQKGASQKDQENQGGSIVAKTKKKLPKKNCC